MNNETNNLYSDLIAEIKAIQEDNNLTAAEISRQSGISKATLSQFLAGKYAGDNEKIAVQARRWIGTVKTREQVKNRFRSDIGFLELPSSRHWAQVFEYAQMAGDIGVITGAPGTSKTMTAEHYCRNASNAWLITADGSLRSPNALLREIAEVVDCPVKSGSRLMRALVQRLRNTGGLLIIDEAQHLTTEALDQLRALNDQAGIGLAWIGNEPLQGRIEGMGASQSNAQIFSRVGMWKRRSKPTKRDIDQVLEAWEITEPAVVKLLHWIGQREGGLRELSKTLRFAYFIAAQDQRDTLQVADIEAGWNQRKPAALPANRVEA